MNKEQKLKELNKKIEDLRHIIKYREFNTIKQNKYNKNNSIARNYILQKNIDELNELLKQRIKLKMR